MTAMFFLDDLLEDRNLDVGSDINRPLPKKMIYLMLQASVPLKLLMNPKNVITTGIPTSRFRMKGRLKLPTRVVKMRPPSRHHRSRDI